MTAKITISATSDGTKIFQGLNLDGSDVSGGYV
jgi:hypothetical protein